MAATRAGVIDKGGLRAAQSALRQIDRELPKAGKAVLDKAAKTTHRHATARAASAPGAFARSKWNLKPYATQRDAGLRVRRLKSKPLLEGPERGADAWHMPQGRKGAGVRPIKNADMRPPMFGRLIPRGKNTAGIQRGHIVAPTIAKLAPQIEADLIRDLHSLIDRNLTRRLPHG